MISNIALDFRRRTMDLRFNNNGSAENQQKTHNYTFDFDRTLSLY